MAVGLSFLLIEEYSGHYLLLLLDRFTRLLVPVDREGVELQADHRVISLAADCNVVSQTGEFRENDAKIMRTGPRMSETVPVRMKTSAINLLTCKTFPLTLSLSANRTVDVDSASTSSPIVSGRAQTDYNPRAPADDKHKEMTY